MSLSDKLVKSVWERFNFLFGAHISIQTDLKCMWDLLESLLLMTA